MLNRYTIREFQIKTVIGCCNGTLGIANIKNIWHSKMLVDIKRGQNACLLG